ncbi:uncharacterized protein F4807DRAFT_419288 [Annulohypoxylon truncatum]|uniref:uncharacterized protein n=1 Tax=Annulohypoxylon truncatum TaxID=327061 RepID=UPI0020080256|nr:uncharacterized protein F4807DRAFT_419288 [Annulohypoxylon truncatum]KAI1211178.1 hypothetical protein F4807DRAFT_419288 [Annulohypoxylon truncatum]
MKFSSAILFGIGLVASSSAHPLEERDVQVAHLTFHGGPASYDLAVPADGSVVNTNNDISVSIIDAPDYDAITQCTFNTASEKTLVSSIDTQTGLQSIIVGPPQPIISVSCNGACTPTYGVCFDGGKYLAPCCNGFCAATRCRPWNITSTGA